MPEPRPEDGYGIEDEPAPPPPVARHRPTQRRDTTTDAREWTFERGVVKGVTWIALVAVVTTPIWALALFLARGATEWIGRTAVAGIAARAGILLALATALAIVAVPVGRAVSHRLTERFGIDGPIPAGFGVAGAWIIAWGGYSLGTIGLESVTWVTGSAMMVFGLEASAVVVWRTWLDPE